MEAEQLKIWLEGALLAAGQPLNLSQLNSLFAEGERPGHGAIREALALLDAELSDRAVELVEVAGGYRLQIRRKLMPVVSQLWAEKPPRYSRALLETLAIVAYRQPITRGEIEQIRGVSLSANILKTLQEREWIKVVGHRDIPGKPELLGTTRLFLDYFGLKGLDDLPTLAEIRDLDNIEPELELNDPEYVQAANHDQQEHSQQEQSQQDHEQAERSDVESATGNDTQGSGDGRSGSRDEKAAEEEGERNVQREPGADQGQPGPDEPNNRSGSEETSEPEQPEESGSESDRQEQQRPAAGGREG